MAAPARPPGLGVTALLASLCKSCVLFLPMAHQPFGPRASSACVTFHGRWPQQWTVLVTVLKYTVETSQLLKDEVCEERPVRSSDGSGWKEKVRIK